MALYAMIDGKRVKLTAEQEASHLAQQAIDMALVENAASQPYRLYKSVFINRMTDEEATTMEVVLGGAAPKLRLMFNSVEYFVSDDPLFATLLSAVGAALGQARAEELLAAD